PPIRCSRAKSSALCTSVYSQPASCSSCSINSFCSFTSGPLSGPNGSALRRSSSLCHGCQASRLTSSYSSFSVNGRSQLQSKVQDFSTLLSQLRLTDTSARYSLPSPDDDRTSTSH